MQEGKHTCKFMREKQRQKSAQIRSSLCRISSGFYSNGGYCMETGHKGHKITIREPRGEALSKGAVPEPSTAHRDQESGWTALAD